MAKRKRLSKEKIQWSKKRIRTVIIWILIFIIPSFLLWGIATTITSSKYNYFGTINGRKVSRAEWSRAVKHQQFQLIMMGIDSQVYNNKQFVDKMALRRFLTIQDAKKKRIKVSDNEVQEYIANLPFLKDKDGNFSFDTYKRFLAVNRIPPAEFEAFIREEIAMDKLYKQLTDGITVTEDDVKEHFIKKNEAIDFLYTTIDPASMQGKVKPKEDELRAYYEKTKEKYKHPERINCKFIEISTYAIKGALSDVKDEEEKNRIAQERYNKIVSQLKIGKKYSLEALSKISGLPIKETGFFSENSIIQGVGYVPTFTKEAFGTEVGQTSPLFDHHGRLFALKVLEKEPTGIYSFEDARHLVETDFIREKAKEVAEEEAKAYLQSLKPIMEELASIEGNENKIARLNETGREWISAEGKHVKDYVQKIGPLDKIYSKIKETAIASPGIAITDTSVVVFIPLAVHEANLEQLKEEYDKVKEELLNEKKNEFLGNYVENLASSAKIKTKDENVFSDDIGVPDLY